MGYRKIRFKGSDGPGSERQFECIGWVREDINIIDRTPLALSCVCDVIVARGKITKNRFASDAEDMVDQYLIGKGNTITEGS